MILIARPFSRYWKNTLTPLRGKIKQFDYIGFDVETYGDENIFYSGGLYYYNDEGEEVFEYYTDKEKLISSMLSRRFRNKTFVATNLGFDLTSLFFDTPYWNNFRLTSRGSDILLASYELDNNNGKIKIIDTFNFVPFSVEKLGKIIGSSKIDKPSFWERLPNGDLNAIIPRNKDDEVELELYNKQDCKISCDFMYFLQKGINEAGGNLKITIASTSLDVWRRSHLKQNITKENFFFPNIKDFIFKGYYGGRTEVFKRGFFEDVNYYDINSLYPSVMRKDYPDPTSIKKVDLADISYIHKYDGVSECDVTAPVGLNIPLLPIKTSTGKLIFPLGNFQGTWNNVELRKAIELGYKIVPIKQVIYTKTFNPFKSYVETFYAKRLEYKKEGSNMELIMKLLLNSLYGKFSQKEKQQMSIKNTKFLSDDENIKLMRSDDEVNIKNNHLIKVVKSDFDGLFSLPILSSYTTSYARLLMYDYISRDDCIYTDTDSVVIKGELPTGKALGEMKLEYFGHRAVFVKPKFYSMDSLNEVENIKIISKKEYNLLISMLGISLHKFYSFNIDVKIKGVNRASIGDFSTIIKGGSVDKVKFSKLRESIRRGLKPNTKINVNKTLGLEDNKREWKGLFSDLIEKKTFEESKPLILKHVAGINMTEAEESLLIEKMKNKEFMFMVHKINDYLNINSHLKVYFKGFIHELKVCMVNALNNDYDLDLIDWVSLDKDNLYESLYDNYNIVCEVEI